MDKEITNKKIIIKLIALAISTIIILLLYLLKTHQNQNFVFIIIVFMVSLLLIVVYGFFMNKATRIKNYYYQGVDFMVMLNIAILFVQVFFIVAFYPATVKGKSMEPTLMDEDTLLVQALAKPKQGSVVVIEVLGHDMPLVKRIIAVGGDVVYINEENYLVINGEILYEEYINILRNPRFNIDFGFLYKYSSSEPYVLPVGEYLIMGDNRGNSTDSRYFGSVSASNILGVVKYKRITLFDWVKVK